MYVKWYVKSRPAAVSEGRIRIPKRAFARRLLWNEMFGTTPSPTWRYW
jgi:hypothetical protein